MACTQLVEYTDFGLIVRAGTLDGEMVRLLGIKLSRPYLVVFGIGAALAGVAGVVGGPLARQPHIGTNIRPGVPTVVIGGVGSIDGAVIAGDAGHAAGTLNPDRLRRLEPGRYLRARSTGPAGASAGAAGLGGGCLMSDEPRDATATAAADRMQRSPVASRTDGLTSATGQARRVLYRSWAWPTSTSG